MLSSQTSAELIDLYFLKIRELQDAFYGAMGQDKPFFESTLIRHHIEFLRSEIRLEAAKEETPIS